MHPSRLRSDGDLKTTKSKKHQKIIKADKHFFWRDVLPRVRTIIICGHDKAWPSRIDAHSATYGLPLVKMTEKEFKELGFLNPLQHIQAKGVCVDSINMHFASSAVASRLFISYRYRYRIKGWKPDQLARMKSCSGPTLFR